MPANGDSTAFMTNWFPRLPLELQTLIIGKTYRMPPPRFRRGNIVTYNAKHKEEMRASLARQRKYYRMHYEDLGEQPFGRLVICYEPKFDWARYEWAYDYEYGPYGTSEGCALESLLESVPRFGGLTNMTR